MKKNLVTEIRIAIDSLEKTKTRIASNLFEEENLRAIKELVDNLQGRVIDLESYVDHILNG